MDSDTLSGLLADVDSSGKSALHHAAWRGHADNVQALLDVGADVNAWSTGEFNYGKTPVFYAITRCRDAVVLQLLCHGAKTKIVNNKGQSVLSLAASHCSPETVAAIEEAEKKEAGQWLNFRASHSDGLSYGDLDPRFVERPIDPEHDVVQDLVINPTSRESRQEIVELRNAAQDAKRASDRMPVELAPEEQKHHVQQMEQPLKHEPKAETQSRSQGGTKRSPPEAFEAAMDLSALMETLETDAPAEAVADAAEALVRSLLPQKGAWLPVAAARIRELPKAYSSRLREAAACEQPDQVPAGSFAGSEEAHVARRTRMLRTRLLRTAASPLSLLASTSPPPASVVRPVPLRLLPEILTAEGPLQLPTPEQFVGDVEGVHRLRELLSSSEYVGIDTEWALDDERRGKLASNGSMSAVASDGVDGTRRATVAANEEEALAKAPAASAEAVDRTKSGSKRSKEKLAETCQIATIQLACDHTGATFVLDALLDQKPVAYATAMEELFTWLLRDPAAPKLVGFAFSSDALLLERWCARLASQRHAGAGSDKMDASSLLAARDIRRRVLDVQEVAMSVGVGSAGLAPSLSATVAAVLGKGMDKGEQCSDWSQRPLRDSQRRYAALDALACVRVRARLFALCTPCADDEELRVA